MTTGEAVRILKAAMVAIEAGNLKAAREMIASVIAGLNVKRHK